MGMDLKPLNPTKDAPMSENGHVQWGRYNWSGWRWITNLLEKWEMDLSEFKGSNDGDVISAETCIKVADAMEAHADDEGLKDWERKILKEDAILWRTCGGYAQY